MGKIRFVQNDRIINKKILMQNNHEYQFYGRKKGRKISKKGQELIENLLPKVNLNLSNNNHQLDHLIDKKSPILLDIGFGSGDFLYQISRKKPKWNFIGIDLYLNGIVSLLRKIEHKNNLNLRIVVDDARIILNNFKSNSISIITLLFPDPWRKTKHKSRRFIQLETVKQLYRILKPGGRLIISSDDDVMQTWILKNLINYNLFDWKVKSIHDCFTKPKTFTKSKYFTKAEKVGRKSAWFIFSK